MSVSSVQNESDETKRDFTGGVEGGARQSGIVDSAFSILVTEELVYAALKEVMDPELGLNIVDLGLIYSVEIGDDGHIKVAMTLTTPGCPLHASFKNEIETALWRTLPGLQGVSVDLVWQPPWTPDMITPEGRAELGGLP